VDLRRRPDFRHALLRMFFALLTVLSRRQRFWQWFARLRACSSPSCSWQRTIVIVIVSTRSAQHELRFEGFDFVDGESKPALGCTQGPPFPVLVPTPLGIITMEEARNRVRARHRLAPIVPLVFVESTLGDAVTSSRGAGACRARGRPLHYSHHAVRFSCSCAGRRRPRALFGHGAAEIHFGWSDESPVTANLKLHAVWHR